MGGLGIDINQIKKDLASDDKLFKGFIDDVNLIVGRYGSSDVKNEKEFKEIISRIDSEISFKKRSLDENLKIISSDRIKIDKISNDTKPFNITYSITLKEVESPYKERTVFVTDSENIETKLKLFLDDGYIDIPDINFHSISTTQSKDGNFVLAYNDEYLIENGKKVKGEVAFVNLDKLFLISELQRPNDGKLASNGNFIINDWISNGTELAGTFYAFNSDTEILIKRNLNSIPGNNGISENGQYAILETNYSDSDDGNKIFFFDLSNQKLLWERERDAGNVEKFNFDNTENILLISYEKGGEYRYSFEGEFSDKDKFMKERVIYANGYELLDIAKEKMGDLDYKTFDLSDYEEVLAILVKASKKEISPNTKVRINRIIGEINYNYGKNDEALKNFEKALSYNPNIGVKRLYDKLKKI